MTSPPPNFLYPEERRNASVLFAEIVGLNAFSEKCDYDTLADTVKRLWLQLDTVIEAQGGFVDKHMGDGVMAVWGAPYVGENDAERAVLAALDLLEALKKFAGEANVAGLGELRLRVGIHSGVVYAGYVGLRNEYALMGETVSVANRLAHFAEPGTAVMTESTFRLVRGIFQVRRLATALQSKGKTEPVQAYLVDGLMPQPSRLRYRSVDSLETCMVGRELEMERMNALYQQAIQSDLPVMVLVTGEAGLGKSRLLMEFTSSLEVNEAGITLMSARSLAQASQVPFFLWKSLWFLRFGLQDSDPVEVSREKFLREVQRLWGFQLGPASSVEAAHLIGSLIGLNYPDSTYLAMYENNPKERVRRAFELTRELLRRICAYRPTVLLLDDLQWADSSSLELLAYLFEPAEQPLQLMILAGGRLEFARQHPHWLNIASIIQLEPLPVEASVVAAAYPDLRMLPDEVLLEMADRADGNPYFMEEMAKSLVKAGLHQDSFSSAEIVARLRSNPPESLRLMLQARLDSLTREARAVALLAAVAGRVFWVGAVVAEARVAEDMGTGPLVLIPDEVIDRLIQDSLRQLIRAEMAFPRANVPYSEDQEYIFKHSLLREVAYGLIPQQNRSRYHLAVALWLANHPSPDYKIMAAEHFEQGGALAEAAMHFEGAAEIARMRGAERDAEALVERARRLRERLSTRSLVGPP